MNKELFQLINAIQRLEGGSVKSLRDAFLFIKKSMIKDGASFAFNYRASDEYKMGKSGENTYLALSIHGFNYELTWCEDEFGDSLSLYHYTPRTTFYRFHLENLDRDKKRICQLLIKKINASGK